MTNVSDAYLQLAGIQGSSEVQDDLLDFFADLPQDLDLGSAAYYLKKEFKRNDTGIDDRVQIFTFDPEPADDEGYWDSSGYDSDDDYDEDASWREDYY